MSLTLPNTQSQTANDLVSGALRDINSLEAGEVPDAVTLQDSLREFNNMLELWSTENLHVYASTEYRFNWVPGQYQYTIGNPLIGTFSGTLTSGSPIITAATVPANLGLNAYLTDDPIYGGAGAIPVFASPQNALGPNTPSTIVNAIGANTVTMSALATSTPVNSDVIAYSQPGDIAYDSYTGQPLNLPIRITNAFTRITVAPGTPMVNGLDYQIAIINRDQYTALGYKGINGPWPTRLYYDRTFPLGNIYIYPNPSQAGECHLWCDLQLTDMTSGTTPLNFPIGYAFALQKNLALVLSASYGKTPSPLLMQQATQGKAAIKRLNAVAPLVASFDVQLVRSRRIDASWILDGGFNR
jgi:hypothetical protein